jgi:hypothetical protein
VEGPTELIVERRDSLPADVSIICVDGPDPSTLIMVWPAAEITERGARLLEQTYRHRRRQAAEKEAAEQRTG